MTLHIGIDPGMYGAVAFMDGPERLDVIDMPLFSIEMATKSKGGKPRKRNEIDLHALLGHIRRRTLFADATPAALIEKVGAMPREGAVGAFTFGFSTGALHGLLVAMGIPYDTVTPQKWKKALGLTGDKDASRRLASRLMPQHAHLWPLKKHDGRAEAALIAWYAARQA